MLACSLQRNDMEDSICLLEHLNPAIQTKSEWARLLKC